MRSRRDHTAVTNTTAITYILTLPHLQKEQCKFKAPLWYKQQLVNPATRCSQVLQDGFPHFKLLHRIWCCKHYQQLQQTLVRWKQADCCSAITRQGMDFSSEIWQPGSWLASHSMVIGSYKSSQDNPKIRQCLVSVGSSPQQLLHKSDIWFLFFPLASQGRLMWLLCLPESIPASNFCAYWSILTVTKTEIAKIPAFPRGFVK